ncbi:Uncharacterised protein [Klebsiella pneumoniae]|nr:Uncharacterised protein [Klebsiella pneumoniae]
MEGSCHMCCTIVIGKYINESTCQCNTNTH